MPRRMITVSAMLAGVLMATFQLLRPWGDIDGAPVATAEAFADPRWVIAHLAGAAAFVALVVLARGVAMVEAPSPSSRSSRVTGVAWIAMGVGAVLVLPYYGAETFALHEIGRAALDGSSLDVVALSNSIRTNLVAMILFGLGLLFIAVAGVCLSTAAVRLGVTAWAAWPLGVLIALALPQFALPPVGRMIYGVAFLIAAVVFAVGARPATAGSALRQAA